MADWALEAHPQLLERLALVMPTVPGLSEAIGQHSVRAQPACVLGLEAGRLALRMASEPDWSGISVDFLAGEMAHRQRAPIKGEAVVKAVWGRVQPPLRVLDATAGLGRDAFLLALSGAEVVACERHPAVALLLADGLWRAATGGTLSQPLSRLRLIHAPADTVMQAGAFDVIYLDPMFPAREKSALVKKEMRAFKQLVGDDADGHQWVEVAKRHARLKVVVKRPSSAAPLAGPPAYAIGGRTNRFDVYLSETRP